MTKIDQGNIVLLSTAYFPPVEYFVLLKHASGVQIDLHETYPKQTWRNRCRIITGNGIADLSVPVERPDGNHTPTSKVLISNHCQWAKNHWKSIESAYRNAPFFMFYSDLVEELICGHKEETLTELNVAILKHLCNEIAITTQVIYPTEFIRDTNEDILDARFCISPKARDDKKLFSYQWKPYYQVFDERFGFIPNASILDLLFNMGPDTSLYLQSPFVDSKNQ
jgi:hypothetical protein